MSNSSFTRKISSVSIVTMIFVSACGERDSSPQAGTAHSPSAAEHPSPSVRSHCICNPTSSQKTLMA